MRDYSLSIVLLSLSLSCWSQTTVNFDNANIQDKLTEILGNQSDTVLHAVIPFEFGWENGGLADVYIYEQHIPGIIYITGDLIGKNQKPSDAGNYELMVCHRKGMDWGPELISNLAYFTLDESINSGETMDLSGRFLSDQSKISSVIFDKYANFKVDGSDYGLMLVIGITSDELAYKEKNGGKALIEILKEKGIYPFTDLDRESVFNE